jgi:hypothetical protein
MLLVQAILLCLFPVRFSFRFPKPYPVVGLVVDEIAKHSAHYCTLKNNLGIATSTEGGRSCTETEFFVLVLVPPPGFVITVPKYGLCGWLELELRKCREKRSCY